MPSPPPTVELRFATQPVGTRLGSDGLHELVRSRPSADPPSSRNRTSDRSKGPYRGGHGSCPWGRRLERGRDRFPDEATAAGVRRAPGEFPLCGPGRRAAERLKPLRDRMHRRVLAPRAIWTDDARSRYAEPGRDAMPRGHFGAAIGDVSAPFTVLDFTTGAAAPDGPEPVFAGCPGDSQADGSKPYGAPFAKTRARHVARWARARREFLGAGTAAQPVVGFIRRLYRIGRT